MKLRQDCDCPCHHKQGLAPNVVLMHAIPCCRTLDPSYLYDDGFACVYFLMDGELMDAPMNSNGTPDWQACVCVADYEFPMERERNRVIQAALKLISGDRS